MSDDCFFNPEACNTAEADATMEEESDMWEPTDEEKQWMFEGNLAFLLMSFGGMFTPLMDVMSWKWNVIVDGTDADGDTQDEYAWYGTGYDLVASEDITSDYQLLAGQIETYGSLAIWGAAFVTQALSMAGIAVGVNMMVWGYGVMLGGSIVSGIVAILLIMSHFKAWNLYAEDADEDDDIDDSNWMSYAGNAEDNMVRISAWESAVALTAWAYGEAWMVAQWWALPEEERQEAWDAHEAENGEHGKEMMLNRLFRF